MLTATDNQLRTNFICKELKITQMGDVHTKAPTTPFLPLDNVEDHGHVLHILQCQ